MLEEWTGRDVGWACGTDAGSRRGYRDAMAAAGYATAEERVDYEAPLDVDEIVGGVFSAMSADQLPDAGRPAGVRRTGARRARAAHPGHRARVGHRADRHVAGTLERDQRVADQVGDEVDEEEAEEQHVQHAAARSATAAAGPAVGSLLFRYISMNG